MTDSSVGRLSLQEHTATYRTNELPIPRLDLAAHRYDSRAAFLLPSLIGVVVHIRMAAFLRERAAVAGIVDDQIGVAAELNRAFPRVQAEQLRGLRRAHGHQRL